MRNICLVISYVGTKYSGFQVQKNGLSIQEVLESAIENVTHESVRITPSGRTDAGVHALAQMVNFKTNSTIPADKFYIPLNQILPQDIRVMSSCEVSLKFDARKCAKRKTYEYKIYTGQVLPALDADRVLHYPKSLDINKMQQACKLIVGEHDFSAFVSSGASTLTTIRKIYSCSVKRSGEYLTFSITGNGFLYNMVRILVGTILEVGRNKKSINDFKKLLAGGERRLAGKTVSACGLYLKKVLYSKTIHK